MPVQKSIFKSVAEIVTGVGANIVGATDGRVGGVTMLDRDRTRVAVLVECSLVTRLVIRYGARGRQRRVVRREVMGLPGEPFHCDTEVVRIAFAIARFDLDDGLVLGTALLPLLMPMGGERTAWP